MVKGAWIKSIDREGLTGGKVDAAESQREMTGGV